MINLLPSEYQKQLKREKSWRLFLLLEIIFLVFLFSLSLILLSLSFYIKTETRNLRLLEDTEKESFLKTDLQKTKEESIFLDKAISKIKTFYMNQPDTTEIFINIFQTIPREIYLNSFSWQKKDSTVFISGFSPTREALLQLKNNLKRNKGFSRVEFPLSTWQTPKDIYFNLNLELKTLKEK